MQKHIKRGRGRFIITAHRRREERRGMDTFEEAGIKVALFVVLIAITGFVLMRKKD
jgi:uncharacterized iron-regulated membrane protein